MRIGACPYTSLTRLHVVVGEGRGFLESMLQHVLCLLYNEAKVDAVPLVYETSPEEAADFVNAARRLARGCILTSYTLGVITAPICDDVDNHVARLGYTDTLVFRETGVSCHAYLPIAFAECIPRGYSALVGVEYRWEAKLLAYALRRRGYRRVVVALPPEKYSEPNIASIEKLFVDISVDVIPADLARHYLEAVDIVLDTGVLPEEAKRHRRYLDASLARPTKLLPCVLGVWASRALLAFEEVFIEPRVAAKLAESLLGS